VARVSVTSSSSSRVSVSSSGRHSEARVRTTLPVPHRLTADQILGIREAFRKAGIEFECREAPDGSYEVEFKIVSREE
jgi:hypothetical protein